ncbi:MULTISPECIES: TRAP transporter small permease [unclassified Ornithinimicrobium]|uniref:TRAP transporter small permease n=1 Tax=unclassified Ornithinimicrobium TaxID=2615080 RepID=UPI003852806F
MDAIKKGLDRVLSVASIVLFAVLVVIVVWQVFSRQVLTPSTWTEEASRMTFVWLGFFATALVFSEKGHIAVDYLVRKLPLVGRKAVGVFVQLSIIAMAVLILGWGGWRASQGAWNQQLSSLPATLGQMYLVMPITGVLILFYALHHLVDAVRGDPFAHEEDLHENIVEKSGE